MKTFLLPRRDKGGALTALAALTSAFLLSVSSAKANTTTWTDFTTGNGLGPNSATSGLDFSTATLKVQNGGYTIAGSPGSFSINGNINPGDHSTLQFNLISSGTVSLDTLTYTYTFTGSGTPSIDWGLGSHNFGAVNLDTTSGSHTGSVDLTLAGGNATGTTFSFADFSGELDGLTGGANITFSQFSITAVSKVTAVPEGDSWLVTVFMLSPLLWARLIQLRQHRRLG